MPRKLGAPENASVRAYRSIWGDQLIAGTLEEFQERDTYDEELPGDEESKKPRVSIPNLSRTEFLRRLPEQQNTLGLLQRGMTTFAWPDLPQAFIRGIKHVSTTPLSELKPSEYIGGLETNC
jgi:hypothetical protein